MCNPIFSGSVCLISTLAVHTRSKSFSSRNIWKAKPSPPSYPLQWNKQERLLLRFLFMLHLDISYHFPRGFLISTSFFLFICILVIPLQVQINPVHRGMNGEGFYFLLPTSYKNEKCINACKELFYARYLFKIEAKGAIYIFTLLGRRVCSQMAKYVCILV